MNDQEFDSELGDDPEADQLLAQYYEDLTKDNQNRAPGLWRLPLRHAFAHSYSHLLNDVLGHMVADSWKEFSSDTFDMTDLSEQERSAFIESKLEGSELIEWFETHGHRDFVERLFEKRVIGALVMDANTFIYEALRCSEKGKLVVAFTLLRKPLRENLLILELLLADRARFFELFANDIAKLGIYSLPKSATALPIITSALSLTRLSGTFDSQFLFDLRYAKHQHFSLEGLWNQAAHLVTGDKYFPTAPENFNFIFSGSDADETQWDALYARLPYLLLYFVEIVECLKRRVVDDWEPDEGDQRQRELGFAIAGHLRGLRPFGKSALSSFSQDCPLCAQPVLHSLKAIHWYYWTRTVRCECCGVQIIPMKGHYSKLELFLRQIRGWVRTRFS